ncbi:MAG: phosphodiester glycosidase family protein [Firmicutes bacterium]|nr:phosphodiester glycosidase family protein [Bacillota bacterium]
MKKIKNIIKTAVLTATLTAMVLPPHTALAAYTLYEKVTNEDVVKGVTYQKKHRLTDEGWLDLHILNIDLSNENIRVEPVLSQNEPGLREKVGALLGGSGALAGVNSAYFGLTGKYSSSFGPTVKDGDILSIDTDKNLEKNQFGTYYEDLEGIGNFEYFKTNIQVFVDGNSYFEFAGINTITEMIYPICMTRTAGTDTAAVDARFGGLAKIVVTEGEVTKISEKGEVVEIPENGYVIVLSSEFADAFLQYFYVGQKAELRVVSTIDMAKVQTAISGGGVILRNGEKPEDYGEMASGRQPRTLLGVSEDQKTMKLIVADGKRSNGNNKSIGLTVDEAVELLKAEGLYNGLNLDGGGSSLMAVKTADSDSIETVSSPAEGSERPVMTAVGVFDTSAVGEAVQLVARTDSERVAVGESVGINVFGYDENLHKINIPAEQIKFSCDESLGTLNGNLYTPLSAGSNIVTVEYNGITANVPVNVVSIIEMRPENDMLNMNVGESREIRVKGITSDGHDVDITGKVNMTTDFGSMNGSVFTAVGEGGGYVACEYNGLTCYVKIVVGTKERQISSFEDVQYLNYSSYPNGIEGIAGVSRANVSDGSMAVGLSYYLKESEATQAVYLGFPSPKSIEGKPKALKLAIKGNGSGQWVRGKIEDSNGKEHTIEFTQNVNWTDWRDATAQIPAEAAYPIKLTTIYVAALSNSNTNQQAMYFDNLRGEFPTEVEISVPQPIRGLDLLEGDTSGKDLGYTYINFSGSVTSGNADGATYDAVRNQVSASLGTNSDIVVFTKNSDINVSDNAEVIKWKDDYAVYYYDSAVLMNVYAKNGGIFETDYLQWQRMKNDALSGKSSNVIIFMDLPPSKFDDADEAELFCGMLEDIKAAGKNVFVISPGHARYSMTVKNGVRYVTMPELWNSDGSVNREYKILRFKASESDVVFEVVNAF